MARTPFSGNVIILNVDGGNYADIARMYLSEHPFTRPKLVGQPAIEAAIPAAE